MKMKPIYRVMALSLVLMLPTLSALAVAVPEEDWQITTGEDYYYTFGIDGDVTLPGSLWDFLSEDMAEGMNDSFNNSYQVGFAEGYEDGYDAGFYNTTGAEYDWDFTNPISTWEWDTYDHGFHEGYNEGHISGWWDLYNGYTYKNETGNYNNWYEEYIGEDEFPGFPQSELDALDLETVYTEFLALEKIFNLRIHIDSIDSMTYTPSHIPGEYYYDIINITAQFKLASESTYQIFEEFVYDYLNINFRQFVMDAFPTPYIAGNMTAGLDEVLTEINNEILAGNYMFENRGTCWGTGQNTEILTDELTQVLVYDALANFGFNFEKQRTYEYGYAQAYEEGYDAGWNQLPSDNPYEGDWAWNYDYGREVGWWDGYWDGNDDYHSSVYHGMYYYNYATGYPEFEDYSEPQDGPEGYIKTPFFIPADLDFGAELEKVKDAANIGLGQSHAIVLGGFNGWVEQLGIDLISNEKQLYIAGDIEDPKWMFGKIIDIGKMLFIDELNEEIDLEPSLTFDLEDDSLEANGLFNIEWNDDGILQNIHQEIHIGMEYVPSTFMGINLEFDLSYGVYTELGVKFEEGVLPTQKVYPTSVNGNWGVDEGDVNEFTASMDMNIEMPDSMWSDLNDVLWEGMNETYYDWTGTPLPTSEEVDAELIFETLIDEIPNVIQLESKITDMLGISETSDGVTHEYDFLAQRMLGKLPDDSAYDPIGKMWIDVYNGFYAAVGESFPPSFATELQARLDGDLDDLIQNSLIEGTDISIIEIVQEFVPTTLHMWGISSNSSYPIWAKEMGIVDDLYGHLLSEGTAFPSLLYTPTDFSMQGVYDNFIDWAEIESGGEFTEELLYAFMANLSIDDFYMEEDRIYMRMDVESIDDVFFEFTGLDHGIQDFITELYNTFGEQFDEDSIWGQVLFNWEYDADGVLRNLHLQAGWGMETNDNEELSVAFEFDLSRGEFNGKNGAFPGEPLIHEYDHWLYPDLTYTVILPQGNNNLINIDSDTHDVHMSIEFTATSQVRLSTQIWGEDPSSSDMFLNGTGIFFAIDADDEDAITFPMTLTIDLRPELVDLGEEDLEDLFEIYTWDETEDNWVLEEGFVVQIDMANEQVIIEVTHLSAFAIGASADGGGGGVFSEIPGYETSLFIIAALGTAAFLGLKKRRK